MDKKRLNELSNRVIGAAITVHKELGPGLLESTYEACLLRELVLQGIQADRQVMLPVGYKGLELDCGYKLDLLVEKALVVELKSVDKLSPINEAQIVTYLRVSGMRRGLLINFNERILKQGIRRFVNGIDKEYTSRLSRSLV
jgi:GxxExxY protein